MSMFDHARRDDEWVLRMADAEEGGSIDVGGLHGRLNALKAETAQRSLAHFIELSRRQLGLSTVQLAENAQVRLTDLLALEDGQRSVANPEAVVRLANVLGVDARPLLILAGLSPADDEQLEELAVQFTARLEPVAPLAPREQEALNWFKTAAFRTHPLSVKESRISSDPVSEVAGPS